MRFCWFCYCCVRYSILGACVPRTARRVFSFSQSVFFVLLHYIHAVFYFVQNHDSNDRNQHIIHRYYPFHLHIHTNSSDAMFSHCLYTTNIQEKSLSWLFPIKYLCVCVCSIWQRVSPSLLSVVLFSSRVPFIYAVCLRLQTHDYTVEVCAFSIYKLVHSEAKRREQSGAIQIHCVSRASANMCMYWYTEYIGIGFIFGGYWSGVDWTKWDFNAFFPFIHLCIINV